MAADQEPWVVLMNQLLITFGVITTAFLAYLAQKHAREGSKQATIGAEQSSQVNDAVNHKHTDAPRLFDMVVNLGGELEEHRIANRDQHDVLGKAIQANAEAIAAHVRWEETVKYPQIQAAITPPVGTTQKEGPS